MKKEFKITEEEIRQIHAVLPDGNTPIFDKQSLEKMFPEAFKEDKKELPKYFTGWLKSSNTEDEQWLGYSEEGTVKYGIDSNRYWFYGNDAKIDSSDYEATEAEVFEALKNEAVKRGFVEGRWFGDVHINSFVNPVKNLLYHTDSEDLRCDKGCVFHKGKWAEIIPTITKEEAEKELGKKII